MAANFFTGTPSRNYQQSLLGPEQKPILNELTNSARGSFGNVGNYYNNLLGDDSEDFNSFANPELRRFREQTIPDIAEQYAGMGAGGLSSSGFRNSTVNAGTDLSERLGAIRANLRQQGAQGLMGLGQAAISPSYYENLQETAKPGFLDYATPAIGAGLTAFGGPLLGGLGSLALNGINQSQKGKSPIYKWGQNGMSQPGTSSAQVSGGFGGGR